MSLAHLDLCCIQLLAQLRVARPPSSPSRAPLSPLHRPAQVDHCEARGIHAERWNCEVPEQRKASIAKDMACDEPALRLLYTTPGGYT